MTKVYNFVWHIAMFGALAVMMIHLWVHGGVYVRNIEYFINRLPF